MSGRHIILSGGAGGIGSVAVAELLDRGYVVSALDVSEEGLARLSGDLRAGDRLRTICADITRSGEVEAAVSTAIAAHGEPFGLVNIAGNNKLGGIEDTSDDDWRFILDTNLTSTFFLCRAVLPRMRERGGRVITTASIFGLRGEVDDAAYAAAKAGVIGLTRALAIEWAPFGVTVNCVAPGVVLTPRVRRMPAEHLERQRARIPLGRVSTPQDVTRSYAFLLSDDASFYTGQTFSPNGGDVMP